MLKKNRTLTFLIYLYIALPFIIFAAGFLKWYIAVPAALISVVSLFLAAKDSEGLVSLPFEKGAFLKIAAALVFILLLVLLSGIGNVLWQNNDHATRNTIFDILVEYSWPPKYQADTYVSGLVYYIGFWLPSAIIGKLISLGAGYIFQIVWAFLGLSIIWYLLCVMHKKLVFYPIVIFMFFGGMDILGHSFVKITQDSLSVLQEGSWAFPQGSAFSHHVEWWPKFFQYSSHTTQLFWVFNQSIPVWIATLLLLLEKNNKNLVFIMGVTLLSSTLPFIGLIPVFVWCAVSNHNGDLLDRSFTPNVKHSFLSMFTFQSFFGGGISGIISFLYLKGNIASSQASPSSGAADEKTFSFAIFVLVLLFWIISYLMYNSENLTKPSRLLYLLPALPFSYLLASLPGYKVEYYLVFVVLEFLLLFLVISPIYRKSSLFFLTLSCLLIIPFFTVGKSIDFCMRASIPLLAVLALFSISALKIYVSENKQLLAVLLCTILMLGAITPLREISRTVEASIYEIQTKGRIENDSKTVRQVFGGKNFTGKTENNIFFEYLAK